MSILDSALEVLDRLSPPRVVQAHCDIPCGIYDPHAAQIAALTCIRMIQLMQALPKPDNGASKEQHAALCEHELTVIWTDYFKPEHVEKHPKLPELYWKTAKLTSQVKQTNDMNAAQQLLAGVQEFAEIFWDTKGVKTRRGPSNQTVGGELVYVA